MFGVRMLQVAIDDPEGTRERHAEPACHHRQVILDIFFINQAQRRTRGELIENRPQFDLLVDVLEFLDAFLQALGDRQIAWLIAGRLLLRWLQREPGGRKPSV